MKVHERMRRYLQANGIKFRVIAERSDIQPQRFYRLMSGLAPLVVDEYEVICRKGIGIDPGYFFNLQCLETKPSEVTQ
jgi:transcriptional regulator with XRE-family HTH domain